MLEKYPRTFSKALTLPPPLLCTESTTLGVTPLAAIFGLTTVAAAPVSMGLLATAVLGIKAPLQVFEHHPAHAPAAGSVVSLMAPFHDPAEPPSPSHGPTHAVWLVPVSSRHVVVVAALPSPLSVDEHPRYHGPISFIVTT